MIDSNDFGNRLIQRLDRKMTALEADEYAAEVEIKIINGIIDALRKLKALTQGDADAAGSEIRKYSFRPDAAGRREADTGANGNDAPSPADTEFEPDTDSIADDAA